MPSSCCWDTSPDGRASTSSRCPFRWGTPCEPPSGTRMFDLGDQWVWDFWVCQDDADLFHVFFLKAPRSLGDPGLRHRHASAGHAVSDDLTTWTRVADALDPQPAPAFDDLAIWTGSVVRAPAGDWRMFTTGLSAADRGMVQRIGVATSDDLISWRGDPRPVLEAGRRWDAPGRAGPAGT